MPDMSATRVASLYIHVPFCAQKCAYCAFYSEPAGGETVNRYVAALIRELEMVAGDLKPRTIFFGGGTPSRLNLRQWEQILRAMERLNLLGAEEFTVECNPATVSPDKAGLLRSFGANRISMGVQSLDEQLLERLGRIHTRGMVFKSFDILRRAGFDNLNLDLMFAIPGQTMAIWRATLAEALALGSEHLSSYEVIYEDDTPLFVQRQAGEFDVDEDLACAMYEELVERATAAGFRQYEVANFARDGRMADGRWPVANLNSEERAPTRTPDARPQTPIPKFACKHNVNYWRGGSFCGLGPSATSYVRGVRTKNWSNTQLYCEQLEKGKRAIESREELPPLSRAGETAAFGLRMTAGWPFEEFQRTTNFDLRREWPQEMSRLAGRGWGIISSDSFRLTPQGLRFADAAAELFLR
jgi:oxygen-independent coproporphyrinogen-3 oxidase